LNTSRTLMPMASAISMPVKRAAASLNWTIFPSLSMAKAAKGMVLTITSSYEGLVTFESLLFLLEEGSFIVSTWGNKYLNLSVP